MALTYEWDTPRMDVLPSHNGFQNVVQTLHWTCTGTDENGNSDYSYGTVDLNIDVAAPFIAYNELTKAQTVAWLHDSLGVEMVQLIENSLVHKIQSKLNPDKLGLTAPWAA